MVALSPDTQLGGAWGSGYRYDTDTIKGFSHIHAWQMSGVSVMPVTYDSEPEQILSDYFSVFKHDNEIAQVGYHKVFLERYAIQAELTSTCRVGFHKYTYTQKGGRGVVIKMSGPLGPTNIKDGRLEKVDEYTLIGQMVNEPTRRRPKDLKIYFTIKFDQTYGGDYNRY